MTPVNDFAEFLTTSYAEYLSACADHGWDPVFAYTPTGHTLTIVAPSGARVEVLDQNRPLPDHPANVTEWWLITDTAHTRVAAPVPVTDWAARINDLLVAPEGATSTAR